MARSASLASVLIISPNLLGIRRVRRPTKVLLQGEIPCKAIEQRL